METAKELAGLGLIHSGFTFSFPDSVYCSITVLGIYQLDATLVNRNTRAIIEGLGMREGRGNIAGFYHSNISDFQAYVDFANYLRGLGYLQNITPAQGSRQIIAELTTEGWSEFKRLFK